MCSLAINELIMSQRKKLLRTCRLPIHKSCKHIEQELSSGDDLERGRRALMTGYLAEAQDKLGLWKRFIYSPSVVVGVGHQRQSS